MQSTLSHELTARPALIVFAAASAGLNLFSVPIASLLALLGIVLLLGGRRWRLTAAAAVLGVGASLLVFRPPVTKVSAFQGEIRLVEMPRIGPESQSAVIEAGGQRLMMRLPLDANAVLGDAFLTSGEIRPMREGRWPRRGAVGEFDRTAPLVRTAQGWPLWVWGRDWSRAVSAFLAKSAPGEAAELLQALCFGRVGSMSEATDEALRRSGLAHAAAASGMNVLFISALIYWLLSSLGVGRGAQLWILGGLLVLYAGAAGIQPSILRAVVMFLLLASAPIFRREPDGLTALGWAGLAGLVIDPASSREPGLWLSMAATAGLIMFVPWRRESWTLGAFVLQAVRVSTVAFLAVTPVTLVIFGQAAWLSPLSNLLVVTAIPAATLGSFVAWTASLFFEPLGAWMIQWGPGLWAGYILSVAHTIGGLPWAVLEAPAMPLWTAVAAWVAAFAAWRPKPYEP
jgi:ComEC/Rec2-related protein